MTFKVTVITLYPEMLKNGPLDFSILKRAKDLGIWDINFINIRDFAVGKYKKVDDKLYGGGPGLLIKPDVLSRAIEYSFKQDGSKKLILLTPSGKQLEQGLVKNISKMDGITIICGHFEGIDYRIIQKYNPLEISLGDYIVSGGEIGAIALIDACVRLLPNVLNSKESLINESFEKGLLEESQYTRPFDFEGLKVPEVLLSGNHSKIAFWKKKISEDLTKEKRLDLWRKYKKKEKK